MTAVIPNIVRMGSRTSALAMAQTQWVAEALKAAHPGLTIHIEPMSTQGDERLDTALHLIGDKGLFTKELETAMAAGRIDLAVHSAKDLPTRLPEGFCVQSVGPREDPRDALLGCAWEALPHNAVVGTSSLRRIAQLIRLRPDVICLPVRGNLQTRWRKLQEGQCQALVLAAAGVHRLGWHDRITHYFDPHSQLLPAVGQGTLAVEYRESWVKPLIASLTMPAVEQAWQAERAFLRTLEGGCQVPIGGYCVDGQLNGVWFPPEWPDDKPGIRGQQALNPDSPEITGVDLANRLGEIKAACEASP